MRRRSVLALLGGAAVPVVWPSVLPAGNRLPVVGLLRTSAPPDPYLEAFREAMLGLGYVEGQSVVYETRWAEGDPTRLTRLARELASLQPDVILTGGEAAIRAARDAAPSTPIVMGASNDPVAAGLARSLARPGGTVTGLTIFSHELNTKRLQLLRDALPRLSRVAVLFNPAYPAAEADLLATEQAAQSLGLALMPIPIDHPGQFATVFAELRGEDWQALLTLADPFFTAHRGHLCQVALSARLPTMFYWREFVEAGGFLSYGPDNVDLYRRAATFVHRILNGAQPSELPIEQPTRFVLAVNLHTATTLGVRVPPSILIRADEVIG